MLGRPRSASASWRSPTVERPSEQRRSWVSPILAANVSSRAWSRCCASHPVSAGWCTSRSSTGSVSSGSQRPISTTWPPWTTSSSFATSWLSAARRVVDARRRGISSPTSYGQREGPGRPDSGDILTPQEDPLSEGAEAPDSAVGTTPLTAEDHIAALDGHLWIGCRGRASVGRLVWGR